MLFYKVNSNAVAFAHKKARSRRAAGNEAEADGSKFCGLEFGAEVVTLFNSSQIGYSSYVLKFEQEFPLP